MAFCAVEASALAARARVPPFPIGLLMWLS
eukprot:COSAG04_NODE_31336_length_257_cov_0.658228_1_plen_29_part_10